MGWTGIIATYYKNGHIDRKAECDAYFEGLNPDRYKVLASTMKGSVYYVAIQNLVKYAGKDANGAEIYTPVENGKVWAEVLLTRVKGRLFYYKDMCEFMGPVESNCPASILNLLSDTDSEWALAWRKRCRDNIEEAKKPHALKNLPIGSAIRFKLGSQDYNAKKMAPNCQFKRTWWYVPERNTYIPWKHIPANYEVVEV